MPSSLEKTVKSSGINCIKTRTTICCLLWAQGDRHRRECVNKRIHKTLLDMEFQMEIYVPQVYRTKKHCASICINRTCTHVSETILIGKSFRIAMLWDVKWKPTNWIQFFRQIVSKKFSRSIRKFETCQELQMTTASHELEILSRYRHWVVSFLSLDQNKNSQPMASWTNRLVKNWHHHHRRPPSPNNDRTLKWKVALAICGSEKPFASIGRPWKSKLYQFKFHPPRQHSHPRSSLSLTATKISSSSQTGGNARVLAMLKTRLLEKRDLRFAFVFLCSPESISRSMSITAKHRYTYSHDV